MNIERMNIEYRTGGHRSEEVTPPPLVGDDTSSERVSAHDVF